jgi:hypothetical protein
MDCCENSNLTPCILYSNFSPAEFTTNSKACMGVGLIPYTNAEFTGHKSPIKVQGTFHPISGHASPEEE